MFYLKSSCWLPSKKGIMWAFIAPVIAIIMVCCIQHLQRYINVFTSNIYFISVTQPSLPWPCTPSVRLQGKRWRIIK